MPLKFNSGNPVYTCDNCSKICCNAYYVKGRDRHFPDVRDTGVIVFFGNTVRVFCCNECIANFNNKKYEQNNK